MKSFREQFIECSKNKLHGDGPFLKWKDHPELLPIFPKAARAVARVLKKDPEAGLQTISCLKFGGQCSSGHPQCRELRNATRTSQVERGLSDSSNRDSSQSH